MNYSAEHSRRAALRHAADALHPGPNAAWDEARRAIREIEFMICDVQDAENEALADPMTRIEAAAAYAEMRDEHIAKLIEDAGEEYVGVLISRIETAVNRIRARLLKDEP